MLKKWFFCIILTICIFGMNCSAYAAYSGCTNVVQNAICLMKPKQGHQVSFDLKGGVWAEGYMPPEYRELNVELTLPTDSNLSREGYIFAGWYLEEDYSGEVQITCPVTQQNDIVYYAKWLGNAYMMSGKEFNSTVKTLINGSYMAYSGSDKLMVDIQWSDSIPEGVETVVVSDNTGSSHQIKAYFDSETGTVYLVNIDNVPVYLDSDCSYMFYRFNSLATADMTEFMGRFIHENVDSMAWMFSYCYALTDFTLKNLNICNATSLQALFTFDEGLTSLDLSGWNTGNVENMASMFSRCSNILSLNLEGWTADNATSMHSAFAQLHYIKEIDLSHWNTPRLEELNFAFSNCKELETLDLSGWDTRNLVDMNNMAVNCYALKTVDLRGWETSNCTKMNNAFQNCNNVTEIRLDKFDMSKASSYKYNMFSKSASVSKRCTIYCTEATETSILSGTGITASYFTFSRPTETESLMFLNVNSVGELEEIIASDSNAEVKISTDRDVEVKTGADSNAEIPEDFKMEISTNSDASMNVASASNAESE